MGLAEIALILLKCLYILLEFSENQVTAKTIVRLPSRVFYEENFEVFGIVPDLVFFLAIDLILEVHRLTDPICIAIVLDIDRVLACCGLMEYFAFLQRDGSEMLYLGFEPVGKGLCFSRVVIRNYDE
jgi:hypothetical protein